MLLEMITSLHSKKKKKFSHEIMKIKI